jgi:putative flippase GtrA
MSRLAQSAATFTRFAAVGVLGFIVDAGLLTIFIVGGGWAVLPAKMLSMTAAITATWLLNRRFTFATRAFPTHLEYVGYFAIQLLGALINLGVFMFCVSAWPKLLRWPALPQAAGSAVALFFNLFVARRVLYTAREVR